jgi:hypothetical protein
MHADPQTAAAGVCHPTVFLAGPVGAVTETFETETFETELCSCKSDIADTLTAWLLCTDSSPPAAATAADTGLASGTGVADAFTLLLLLAAAPELLEVGCSW